MSGTDSIWAVNFLIGADYLNWITDYKGLARGLDNRVNIFFQYGR